MPGTVKMWPSANHNNNNNTAKIQENNIKYTWVNKILDIKSCHQVLDIVQKLY